MAYNTTKYGQNESLVVSASVQNAFGATDTGVNQSRRVTINVRGTGTVYFKIIAEVATLTNTVSSTNNHMILTQSDTTVVPVSVELAPGEILVCINDGVNTPTVYVREIIYVS